MTLGPSNDLWETGQAAGGGARPWARSYPPGLSWREPVLREPLYLALDRAVADYGKRPCPRKDRPVGDGLTRNHYGSSLRLAAPADALCNWRLH